MKKLLFTICLSLVLSSLFSLLYAQINYTPRELEIIVTNNCTLPSAILRTVTIEELAYSTNSSGLPIQGILNPSIVANITVPARQVVTAISRNISLMSYTPYRYFTIYCGDNYVFLMKPMDIKTERLEIEIGNYSEITYKITSK